ncbi:hypothetical protein RHGRI_037137 [Rhododendron griersonianum]|uniref:Uncharacterized protein n=1 Tax=Rhododendron griersonianum TaxID=479676 RepID=A0AAV6HQK2_9ERIC|nr:hypothetical protein RHGRI_037137 [Rhododendron griersonianum]
MAVRRRWQFAVPFHSNGRFQQTTLKEQEITAVHLRRPLEITYGGSPATCGWVAGFSLRLGCGVLGWSELLAVARRTSGSEIGSAVHEPLEGAAWVRAGTVGLPIFGALAVASLMLVGPVDRAVDWPTTLERPRSGQTRDQAAAAAGGGDYDQPTTGGHGWLAYGPMKGPCPCR